MFEHNLTNYEIGRFSRQLIISDFGVEAQSKLKSKSALIIGCGGLGCPAALHLAMSGIGKLGLVDYDEIELSNIHRQIAHNEQVIGKNKAQNLADECHLRNSHVDYVTYQEVFEKSNSIRIINEYDVILDCSDNVVTRYLINDACVLLNKPLVCGSALKFDGQLTVYNYNNGPCMRCVFPKPPPKETVSSCSEAGILGPVVGVIGALQAMEAIKVLTHIGDCLNGRLLIFNALNFLMRTVKLREKNKNCVFCNKTVKDLNDIDYFQFCNDSRYDDKIPNLQLLTSSDRMTAKRLKELMSQNENILLLDVRPKHEFNICSLPSSINTSIDELKNNTNNSIENVKKIVSDKKARELIVICHRGNDSQIAVQLLKQNFENTNNNSIDIKDIIGGLNAWTKHVDPDFPQY